MKLSTILLTWGSLSVLRAALPGCPGQRIAEPAMGAGLPDCMIMRVCASG